MGIGGEDVSVPDTHLHAFGPKLLTVAPPVAGEDHTESPSEDRPARDRVATSTHE